MLHEALSWQFPFESHYADPVYNMLDLTGDFDDDGNAIPDGIPDNPGDILYYRDIRTGQKITTTGTQDSQQQSQPLDKKQQTLCKEAAQHHNDLRGQMLANRRLEFEFTRLTKCGEMAKKGITFASWSPYYRLCQDIEVKNVTGVPQHSHVIPQKVSTNANDLGLPMSIGDTKNNYFFFLGCLSSGNPFFSLYLLARISLADNLGGSFPSAFLIFLIICLTIGLTTFNKNGVAVAAAVATIVIPTVVVTCPVDGTALII
ncbi:MAG: hypothetical protein CM15mV41_0380 [Caudoviricetes sp.]|nr:MAG: hypothetical protein CM15mV41_0380 [Caudoviricetes sp.]